MRLTDQDARWLSENLRKVDVLRDLSDPELSVLSRAIEKVGMASGDVILRQGQRAEAFYLIRSGTVSVWAETPDGSERLAVLKEGESFGEVSILTGQACNAGAIADQDCVLFSLSPKALRKVVKANPSLAEKMSRAVAERRGARALGIDIAPAQAAGLLDKVRGFFGVRAP
jgi:CRP-like cAMP-binding protein